MIRKTVIDTIRATFCIHLRDSEAANHGAPRPQGTGFFVSADGWFITAAHVIEQIDKNGSKSTKSTIASFVDQAITRLTKHVLFQSMEITEIIEGNDFALIKFDKEKNGSKNPALKNGFPHLTISTRVLDIGEPVYSAGYPLSKFSVERQGNIVQMQSVLSPRVTSAVIASDLDQDQFVVMVDEINESPMHYVLDKALNYGNSGGPIVAADTGYVHSFCSRFQPVRIPQYHMRDSNGVSPEVVIPSLYGVTSNLGHRNIIKVFDEHGISYVNE